MKLNDLCHIENSLDCQRHRVAHAFKELASGLSLAWLGGMMALAERFGIKEDGDE